VNHTWARAAFAAALAATALAGCSSDHPATDKAGGSGAPAVLRLAYVDWIDGGGSTSLLTHFAERVARLSGGRLRVRLTDTAYPGPDEQQRIARMVRGGQFDLGWIPTGAWDELGVTSFRALALPFLLTNVRLMHAVARSALPEQMLTGLGHFGVVGVGVVPDTLLHPVGMRAFAVPADYAGMQFLVTRWQTTDDLLATLGATPVHTLKEVTAGPPAALQPLSHAGPYVSTGNVVIHARLYTLFANRMAFGRLAAPQLAVLRRASRGMVAEAVRRTLSERAAARLQCQNGTIAVASATELAALERAARPITAELERDPQTKRFANEIRRLKASMPSDPSLVVPSGCVRHRHANASEERPRSPSIVNGTYRNTLTETAAAAFGPPANDSGGAYPAIFTWTLQDGKWTTVSPDHETGTYTIEGDRIAFKWPRVGYTLTFIMTRDRSKTIHLKPVLPMDRGDQWVWSGAPWRRIGPPIK
jgi:hypothetical protein